MTTTEAAALASAVSTWSDGATAQVYWKFGTALHTVLAGSSAGQSALGNMEVAMGNGTVTATAAPNGAYGTFAAWSWDGTNNEIDITNAGMYAYYRTNASAASGLGLKNGTGYIYLASDTKYGLARGTDQTGLQIALDSTLDCYWYLPKEDLTVTTGETTATGDRWDSGDSFTGLAGMGANAAATDVDQACFSAKVVVLGAAQLATAGVAALAAALAF